MNYKRYVTCPICKKPYKRIKTQHILLHNMSLLQFNQTYPNFEKVCEELKQKKKICDKKYHIKNKDKILKQRSHYREKNKKIINNQQKVYRLKNTDIINEKSKKYYFNNKLKKKKYDNEYRIKNSEAIKIKRKIHRQTDKYKEQRRNWFKKSLEKNKSRYAWRRLLFFHLRSTGQRKSDKTLKLLGYDHIKLKQRIECQFTEGMNWSNYGEWHIDHKKPLSAFPNSTPAYITNALCNLQPLWKSTKIINNKIYIGNLNKGSKF